VRGGRRGAVETAGRVATADRVDWSDLPEMWDWSGPTDLAARVGGLVGVELLGRPVAEVRPEVRDRVEVAGRRDSPDLVGPTDNEDDRERPELPD
jgi:hypothetical protein